MDYLSGKHQPNSNEDLQASRRVSASFPAVRVALIGCGIIARSHMQFLSDMSNVQVIAACDPDLETARKLTQEWGIPAVYESAEVMLEKERPDAAHILAPPHMNMSLAIIAIKAGCHVLIEKPMALDCIEAETIIQAASVRGVKVCVDYNYVFDAGMLNARRLIASGALGKVIWVDSYYGFDLGNNRTNRLMAPGGERNWTFKLPGGLFQNLITHPLSVALDILGEPTKSQSHARFFRILPHQPMDELRILLETPEAGGLVTVSLAASPKFHTLTIYGTKGSLMIDFAHKLFVPQIHKAHIPKSLSRLLMNMAWGMKVVRGTLRMGWKIGRKKWIHYDGMKTLIREFYSAIQEDRPSPVSPQELIRLMRVMDTTWEQIGPQNIFTDREEL